MIQFPLLTAVRLPGALAFVLLLALALVLPISFVLIWLYRRAVSKSMEARTSSPANETNPLVNPESAYQSAQSSAGPKVVGGVARVPSGAGVAALYSEVRRAPWRAAIVYVVAGACYALILTVASFVSDNAEIFPFKFLTLFWIYFWPIVLTVNLVAAATRRLKFANVVVYFLIFAAITLTAIVALRPPDGPKLILGLMLSWVMINLPGTLLLLTFLNRRVRAVGPMVLIFVLLAVLGSQVALFLLTSSDQINHALISALSIVGLGANSAIIGLLLLGFFIVWPLGWLTLRVIRRLYERKKISDESITIDAIWLLFAFVNSLLFASSEKRGDIWIFTGLLAFLAFKLVVWAGFRLLRSRATQTRETPRLLLLRVFSLGKRSERLFAALTTHWRHVGSIELIAGPDLATDTLEPHEFLDFISGKLARRFIDGPRALEQRISEMDTKPDQDGRFRVNDFFCHDDTWQMVLSRLVVETDAVLMDLRGFSTGNKGCIHEVKELINVAPLGRLVFIVENPRDEDFLRNLVREAWKEMKPTSPNRLSTPDQLQPFHYTGSRGELPQLLRALCVATDRA